MLFSCVVFLSTLETESAIRWEKHHGFCCTESQGLMWNHQRFHDFCDRGLIMPRWNWARPDKTRRFAADMGVSENVVYPYINPMVLLIKKSLLNGYFIGNIAYFQTNPYWRMDFLICKFWWFGDDPHVCPRICHPAFQKMIRSNLHMPVGWVQHGPTFYHVQSNSTGHFVQNTSQTEGVGLFSPTKIESVHSRIPDVLYVSICSHMFRVMHVSPWCQCSVSRKNPLAPYHSHGPARRNRSCFDPGFPPHGADLLWCLGRLWICQRSRSFQLDHWQHRPCLADESLDFALQFPSCKWQSETMWILELQTEHIWTSCSSCLKIYCVSSEIRISFSTQLST